MMTQLLQYNRSKACLCFVYCALKLVSNVGGVYNTDEGEYLVYKGADTGSGSPGNSTPGLRSWLDCAGLCLQGSCPRGFSTREDPTLGLICTLESSLSQLPTHTWDRYSVFRRINMTNSSLSVSSTWDDNEVSWGSFCSRLYDPKPPECGSYAWVRHEHEVGGWIQYQAEELIQIGRVDLKGRKNQDQYVKSFKMGYRYSNSSAIEFYAGPGTSEPKIFAGNRNNFKVVSHNIWPPISCVVIRLYPVTWHAYVSMRWALYTVY